MTCKPDVRFTTFLKAIGGTIKRFFVSEKNKHVQVLGWINYALWCLAGLLAHAPTSILFFLPFWAVGMFALFYGIWAHDKLRDYHG